MGMFSRDEQPEEPESMNDARVRRYREEEGFPVGARAVTTRDWQPIETAPKDGTPFLGAAQYSDTGEWEVLRMMWVEYAGLFGDATYDPFIADRTQPTRWMPLPEPPK